MPLMCLRCIDIKLPSRGREILLERHLIIFRYIVRHKSDIKTKGTQERTIKKRTAEEREKIQQHEG